MNPQVEYLDIRELFFILKKHFLLIILFLALFGLIGYGASRFLITPQYEADATMIVNAAQSSKASDVTYDQITAAQQLVSTYSIILKSNAVLSQVIENLNLDMNANTLSKSITINGVNQTEVIDISVKNPDPQTAADIANEITEVAPKVIIEKVKAGSVETISSAQEKDKPVSPNILLNTAISMLAGLTAAVAVSFIIEKMNNTFTSGEDLQAYLKYPVLGIIPNVKKY